MSTRRAFLGTLGKMLGAGGVLLPLAGNGALALPADLGKAAALPITATPLPISPELARLREIRRELHDIYLWDTSDGRTEAWRDVMVNRHKPAEASIIGRESRYSLYDQELVTFEEGKVAYDHRDAAGFIKLNALRLRLLKRGRG